LTKINSLPLTSWAYTVMLDACKAENHIAMIQEFESSKEFCCLQSSGQALEV